MVSTAGASGLSTDAANLAAGDVVQRTATLENRGKSAIQAIALSASATQSSPLDRDTQFGLRCKGRMTGLVAWRPLAAGSGTWQLGGLASGGTEWLRVSLQLPPDAPPRLAGRTSTIAYRFTAQ